MDTQQILEKIGTLNQTIPAHRQLLSDLAEDFSEWRTRYAASQMLGQDTPRWSPVRHGLLASNQEAEAELLKRLEKIN